MGTFIGSGFVLIIWLFLSLIVALMAENKGHSGIGALILSLLFSPFVWAIVVAASQPNQRELDRKDIKSGKAKRCPACDEIVRPKAKVCKHCGYELTEKENKQPLESVA